MPLSKIPAGGVEATGTPDATTFFRGDNTWAAPAAITSGTAVTASGTSVNFTGIPSTAKRITVMFSGVSLSGASSFLVQIGSGSIVSSGYGSASGSAGAVNSTGGTSSTAGFVMIIATAANIFSGIMTLNLLNGTSWISSHTGGLSNTTYQIAGGGFAPALSGALDRVRITTVNGTDTFDAGTINILWE